jgi:hypothetical protein
MPVEGNISISALSSEMCPNATASVAVAELTPEAKAVFFAAECFVKKRNGIEELCIHHKRRKA